MFTLYYQKQYGDTIVIAKSENLAKLLKIKRVTFDGCFGHPFINGGKYDWMDYDIMDLNGDEYYSVRRFFDAVNNGKYFRSYDYSNRIR